MKIEKSPVIVTGCARSGTSMVAGIINICGAFGGVMTGPTPNNKKGQFENAFIRDQIEKPYLRSIGMDPLGQYPLCDPNKLLIPKDWKEKVHEVMIREGYKGGDWFYKGAKACQLWPIWHYAFPDAKWIIVRRRSADIAESCLKTAFMRYYKSYNGWIHWINEHEKRFMQMVYEAELNVKIVWPDHFVRGNYTKAQEMIEWLGLDWKRDKVINHIEPKLWRTFEKEKNKKK